MNTQKLFDLKGINVWLLASNVGLNLIYTVAVLFVLFPLVGSALREPGAVQVVLMLLFFIGPLLSAWLVTAMAGDGRGPTYGVYGSIGCILLILALTVTAGFFAILLSVVCVAGGMNGGLLAEYIRLRRGR